MNFQFAIPCPKGWHFSPELQPRVHHLQSESPLPSSSKPAFLSLASKPPPTTLPTPETRSQPCSPLSLPLYSESLFDQLYLLSIFQMQLDDPMFRVTALARVLIVAHFLPTNEASLFQSHQPLDVHLSSVADLSNTVVWLHSSGLSSVNKKFKPYQGVQSVRWYAPANLFSLTPSHSPSNSSPSHRKQLRVRRLVSTRDTTENRRHGSGPHGP